MASPSPPKPWERAGAGGTAAAAVPAATQTSTATTATPSASTASPPSLPNRPNSLNSVVNRTASNYSSLNTNRYGTSPYGYGSYGGYNTYSSPYSRFGGGYGSMYGGYGGMYGGMGGMYGGMGGMGPNPNDPNSLTQSFSNSTQATFQLIESIVGAFGGFAQMLESTYMATHSSFFAMVSVAEQFGNLRQTLGSVLGIFTLMRWMRTLIAKLTGRPPPASGKELTPSNFAAFNGGPLPDGGAHPRPSKKPLIMFAIAVFGLPYLMGKLIRTLARGQEEEEQRRMQQQAGDPQAAAYLATGGDPNAPLQLDPSKLDFCRVLYDYSPSDAAPGAVQAGIDLSVKKGDLVAVLSKTDPMGGASEWWRCRARDGRMGYLPSPYLEPIQRRPPPAAITSGASQPASALASRAQTMTGSASAPGSRSATMTDAKPVVDGKPSDIGVESFPKGQFYS